MLLFQRQKLDEIVSEKLEWVNYKATPWERVEDKPESQRRQLSYSLNRQISQCGSKVSCVQQKTVAADMMSCTIEEIMTLHDVPFGEHFQVCLSACHSSISKTSGRQELEWDKAPWIGCF